MTKLFPLIACCIVLGFLSDHRSQYSYTKERYVYKDALFFTILAVCFILFAGLRTGYNDTQNYMQGFEEYTCSGIFNVSWKLGDYPFYNIVRNFLKISGFSSQTFIMVFSVFCIGTNLWFIRKYTDHILLSVFLFIAMGCLGFNMAAIKQCASMAFCVIAVDRQIKGKSLRCIIWVIIASLFHPFALMFLITPFLNFRPFSNRSILLLVIFGALGVNMQLWLGNVLDLFSIMGKDYDESLLVGEGVNIFRLAVVWAPVLLMWITMKYWDKTKEDRVQNIILNLSMLNAEIMFIALFGNPVYFGRLANYFMVFQTIGITYLLRYFDKRSRSIMILVLFLCYGAYCYYGYALSGTSFDHGYSAIKLSEFLHTIRA